MNMHRTLEDTREYSKGVSMETIAVTAQTKLRGGESIRPVVPSISVATTFEFDKVDDYLKHSVVRKEMHVFLNNNFCISE